MTSNVWLDLHDAATRKIGVPKKSKEELGEPREQLDERGPQLDEQQQMEHNIKASEEQLEQTEDIDEDRVQKHQGDVPLLWRALNCP